MAEETPREPEGAGQERFALRGRGRLLLGGLFLAVAFIYLGYLGFQGSTVYYFTVTEALEKGDQAIGETFRVNGKLVSGSFYRELGSTQASFTLVDPVGGQQLQTRYDGVVPSLFFNEHTEIVAEGQLRPDGVFNADLVIVKCPSKYGSDPEPI